MPELDVVGLGTWCPRFANWPDFVDGVRSGTWRTDTTLNPEVIPGRERRRVPRLVKMAVEVMSQACSMAGLDPDDVATVFSSVMGDMQITDYMCKALAETPKLISPTRFHNSVHNAALGYWSIATGASSPGTAVSAYEFTPSMALLEGAIQSSEEDLPVLVVTQEVEAPVALADTCPSEHPFSAAFLLAPSGTAGEPLCKLGFSVARRSCDWPALPPDLQAMLAGNVGARLLPIMAAAAALQVDGESRELAFPVTSTSALRITLKAS